MKMNIITAPLHYIRPLLKNARPMSKYTKLGEVEERYIQYKKIKKSIILGKKKKKRTYITSTFNN